MKYDLHNKLRGKVEGRPKAAVGYVVAIRINPKSKIQNLKSTSGDER
ncbi:MAG: hypothetical protein H6841_03600 [Planctomycetes bacterium]|nr:hypothetical protein [Planctomycetota bacterium]MCB9934205.1 hypothetical protein [Planctomycetota bacterium]